MKAARFTVIIIPNNEDSNRSFSVSRRFLQIVAGTLGLVLVVLVTLGIIYGPRIRAQAQLQEKYDRLASERIQVLDLLRDLNKYKQMDSYIRKSLGAESRINTELGLGDSSLAGLVEMPGEQPEVVSYIANIPSVAPADGFVTQDMHEAPLFTHESHYGIDIAIKVGEPIYAAASGYVVFAGWTYDMGNLIILAHGNGYFTQYGHNDRNYVSQRDFVKRGEVIAQGGNTGISSGPHLHFEVWKDGRPVDPVIFFPQYREKNVSMKNNGKDRI